jgi:hypothetical protein
MTRFARHALLLLALTAATPAFAQDWRVSAISGAKPDRTVYLLDAASIVHNGDTVTFTTQSIFEQVTDTRDFDRSITKRKGSCSAMASQIVQNSYYVNSTFQNTDSTPGNMITHKDGTVMYDALSQACGKKAMEQDSIANPETTVRNYFAK